MKKNKVNLTAIVIAKNEEKKLPGCLETLSWAGEVILINDASTDKTVRIGLRSGAKIYKAPPSAQGNYSGLRNYGISKSHGNWILYIDADERVTPELKKEILTVVKKSPKGFFAYAIPRKNVIFHRVMTHGGWWPDYVKRLFLKGRFNGWTGKLHEEPKFEGQMGHLKNYLIHIKHDSLSEMVEKTNNWSEIEAKLMFDAGHPKMNIPRFFSAMFREFFLRVIQKKAYMDGTEGIIYALYQVFSRFLSYGKLWEMQLNNSRLKI